MTSEDPENPAVSKLVSVPGIAALAILVIALIALSRAFGAENILRELVTEVVAGFGNAILILAIFGLFFRSGLERTIRRAPGGNTLAESAGRLREILEDMDRTIEGWERAGTKRNWIASRKTFDPWLTRKFLN